MQLTNNPPGKLLQPATIDRQRSLVQSTWPLVRSIQGCLTGGKGLPSGISATYWVSEDQKVGTLASVTSTIKGVEYEIKFTKAMALGGEHGNGYHLRSVFHPASQTKVWLELSNDTNFWPLRLTCAFFMGDQFSKRMQGAFSEATSAQSLLGIQGVECFEQDFRDYMCPIDGAGKVDYDSPKDLGYAQLDYAFNEIEEIIRWHIGK